MPAKAVPPEGEGLQPVTWNNQKSRIGVPDPAFLLAQFALAVFPHGKCCAGLVLTCHDLSASLVQIFCIRLSQIPIWLNSNLSGQI
jgi:hypothetical protein